MPEHAPNGRDLNIVSLREHVEEKFQGLQKALDAALSAHDRQHILEQRAVEEARKQVDLRLEKLNELRSEVLQDRAGYVRRDVFETQLKPLEDFRSRALGIGIVLSLVSAALGAVTVRLFG